MTRENQTIDPIDHMVAWEAGRLDLQNTVDLFQYLLDTHRIESLPVEYGRMVRALIDCGLCKARNLEAGRNV